MSEDALLQIGSWRVDRNLRTLRQDSEQATLTPRSWDVLMALAEHPGELVLTTDLLERFWRGSLSDETAVRKAVFEIRKALGDDASLQQIIKTVPKQGYVLVAEQVSSLPESTEPAAISSAPAAHTTSRKRMVWSSLALLVGLVLIAAVVWLPGSPEPSSEPVVVKRFLIDIGPSESVLDETWPQLRAELAMSRDGRRFAYTAAFAGKSVLSVREASEIDVLTRNEELLAPFFSPDGEWIGAVSFSHRSGPTLIKIPVAGGQTVDIAPAFPGTGSVWLDDGTIVHTNNWEKESGPFESLARVDADGGTVERLTTVDSEAGEFAHRRPADLRDGSGILFDVLHVDDRSDMALSERLTTNIDLLDLDTGERSTLIENAQGAQFTGSHILFFRDNAIWAVVFDPVSRTLQGEPIAIKEDVSSVPLLGNVPYAISDNGSAIILPDYREHVPQRQLVWTDHQGLSETISVPVGNHHAPRISPDGTRVAFHSVQDGNTDLWIHEFANQGSLTRVTRDPAEDSYPVWSPDGRSLFFSSDRNGTPNIFRASADDRGIVEQISSATAGQWPGAVTPDGSRVLFSQFEGIEFDLDIGHVPIDDKSGSEAIVQTPAAEASISLSPNGRWIAYTRTQDGNSEVHVQPYPDVDSGSWQISSQGGSDPRWAPTGDAVYFRQGRKMMMVAVNTEPTFAAGEPRELFDGDFSLDGGRQFDVTDSDGKGFVTLKSFPREDTKLIYIENWFHEIEQLAPIP